MIFLPSLWPFSCWIGVRKKLTRVPRRIPFGCPHFPQGVKTGVRLPPSIIDQKPYRFRILSQLLMYLRTPSHLQKGHNYGCERNIIVKHLPSVFIFSRDFCFYLFTFLFRDPILNIKAVMLRFRVPLYEFGGGCRPGAGPGCCGGGRRPGEGTEHGAEVRSTCWIESAESATAVPRC